MTRILAFADTQIGVSTVSLESQRAVLDQIVQIALEEPVDVVLHGGDVFEGPVVTPEHLKCFVDAVRPLRKANIPLIIALGNGRHDAAMREVNALDILRELGIIVCDRPRVIEIEHPAMSICALPWVQPGHLLARLDGNIDHDHANEHTAHLLVQIAGDLLAKCQHDASKILLAHWALSGSALPSGLPVEEMREPILPWAELDAIGYDLVIGAHIHQPQIISNPDVDQGPCVVLGSPQQLNFGETGDHGCWLFDIDDAGVRPEFVPLDSPHFISVDLTIGDDGRLGSMSFRPEVMVPDGVSPFDENMVRVRYSASEEGASRVNMQEIRDLFPLAQRLQIEPQIERKARTRVESITEQLSQTEALVKWCEANEIGLVTQNRMIKRLQAWA